MAAIVLRVALLTVGFAATEVALGSVLIEGSLVDWGLLAAGSLAIVAGSAGFLMPIVEGRRTKEGPDGR